MAILGRFEKQNRDVKDYPVDYGDWLAEITPPDVVTDIEVLAVTNQTIPDESPVALLVDRVDISGEGGAVWLSGGTPDSTYKIDCLTTTAGGRKDEFEFIVKIKEY